MGKTKSFKLTPKHRRFCTLFVKTGNAAEAGRLTGFNSSYVKELMAKPPITDLIRKIEDKAGLTDEFLLKKHMELANCGERNVELGALRLGYQVKKKIGSDELPGSNGPTSIIIIKDSDAGSKVPADKKTNVSIQLSN